MHSGLVSFHFNYFSVLQILIGLLRRYRYLQKHVKDEVEKVITYLKQFTEQQRTCLAIYTALCISENIVSAGVIFELFREHLVKDESLSLAFATTLFTVWLKEKSIGNVGSALRKVNLESQLLVSGEERYRVGDWKRFIDKRRK